VVRVVSLFQKQHLISQFVQRVPRCVSSFWLREGRDVVTGIVLNTLQPSLSGGNCHVGCHSSAGSQRRHSDQTPITAVIVGYEHPSGVSNVGAVAQETQCSCDDRRGTVAGVARRGGEREVAWMGEGWVSRGCGWMCVVVACCGSAFGANTA
jgi:hypothetical protein